VGAGFVERVEAVAGEGGFGEDGEFCAFGGCFAEDLDDAGEVALAVGDGDVDLGDGDGGHGGKSEG
jgi:hypothetical protein